MSNISLSKITLLNAGWEGGNVVLHRLSNKKPSKDNKFVSISKAGGMAVVVSELPSALLKYGKDEKISFVINSVSPYISGAIRDTSLSSLIREGYLSKYTDIKTKYDGIQYSVEVYQGKTDFGYQYLLKSNVWDGKFGGNMSPYVLTLKGREGEDELQKIFEPNNEHALGVLEERAYIVFAQSVAKLYELLKADCALLHDYHSGLAVLYNKDIRPVLIGHNMAYQGIMAINKRLLKNGYYELNHMVALKDLSKRLCLDETVVHKYFRAWCTPVDVGVGNILQAVLKKCRELTGISSTTVSEGYANELKETYEELKKRIENSQPYKLSQDHFDVEKVRMRIKDFYRTHFDIFISDSESDRSLLLEESRGLEELRRANIVGILNGLDQEKHASRNRLLRDIIVNPYSFEWNNIETPLFIKNVIAKDPDFRDGLNYHQSQPIRVFRAKSFLRKILLMESFPSKEHREIWDDTTSFIHYSWGRLVDQKNIPLIISEAEHMTKRGGILILVAANPDDSLARKIEEAGYLKSKELLSKGLRFAFTSKFDLRGSIFAGGADLVHVPSRYEPCGLTDMESYWMGTPVVANLVGGLGKGGYAVGNFTADPTSMESMRLLYRRVYQRAVNMKKYYPQKWRELCLEALNLDFSYKGPAELYINIIQIAMTKNLINRCVSIVQGCKNGVTYSKGQYIESKKIIAELPKKLRRAYLEYGIKFSSYDPDRAFFYGVDNQTLCELFKD